MTHEEAVMALKKAYGKTYNPDDKVPISREKLREIILLFDKEVWERYEKVSKYTKNLEN